MQKKYILILFCFFMSNIVAQLPQNLARFTQTLKNLAAKLPAGVIPPSVQLFDKPTYGNNVPVPPAGGNIKLSDGDIVKVPAGSTVLEAYPSGRVYVTIPATGGDATFPLYGGYVGVTVDSEVILPNGISVQVPAGKYVEFKDEGVVTITPKGVMPPPLGPILNKPAGKLLKGIPPSGGTVEVEGEEITIPPNSTVGIADADKKPIITVSAAGGNVEFPSFSSGGYVGVTIDSEVTLPNKNVIPVPAGKYIAVEEEGVVKITPKGVVPPPLIPPGGKKIPVPSSGEVKLPGGPVKVPKDSTVTELPSGEADIKLSSDSSVTLPNKKVIKAPKGSTIKLDKNGLSTIIIPVSGNEVSVSLPEGTKFSVSNPAIIRAAGIPDENVSPDDVITAPEDVTITVIPQGIVPPPLVSLKPTDRKPENVLKTVGNVIQLKAPDITGVKGLFNVPEAAYAQALSGYISVYCAFNELSRALNGKDLALTFDQFMQIAVRSIKKRRIQVAFQEYIASIFIKQVNEVPQKTIFGVTPVQLQSIYRKLIGNLVGIQAKNFVNDRYKNGATVVQDYLEPSTFILKGQTLIDALAPAIKKERESFIEELTKQKVTQAAAKVTKAQAEAVVSNILALVDYLKQYTKITPNIEIRLDARHVLTELHKQNIFGREEGLLSADLLEKVSALLQGLPEEEILQKKYINQSMPTGRWLQSADIEHLVRDPIVLKAVGLPEKIKDNISVFDDLSLLDLDPEKVLAIYNDEAQGKYAINLSMLERVAREEKNNIHIFIVNIGFKYGGANTPDKYNWATIIRYPNNEYVVVDTQNANITGDINLTIIKRKIK